LLLVQRMEQAALARLENFQRLNPEIGDAERYGDVERRVLERWSIEHIKVTELFEEMVRKSGGAGPPGAPGAPGESGGSDGAGGEPVPEGGTPGPGGGGR
jgi:hypothetical protein